MEEEATEIERKKAKMKERERERINERKETERGRRTVNGKCFKGLFHELLFASVHASVKQCR